jgi:GT2 family glycosyltransferase
MTTDSEQPTFSLIFLTWNAEDCISDTLDSVLNQTYDDYEVIIVDNASEDRTVDVIRDYEDNLELRLVKNERNLGFTDGINKGIEETQGEYICCYNHDTTFLSDYFETLASYVTPDAVWTTARENHRVSTEHRTVRLLGWQRYAFPYIVDSLSGAAKVNFAPGDGIIIPRGIYQEVLDHSVFELPGKGEDVDLSRRLIDSGVPIYSVLDTYSIHPDVGIYRPTIENLKEHLTHALMRYLAFYRNGHTIIDLVFIVFSTVTIPLSIYFGEFPRSESRFRENVKIYKKSDISKIL